MIMERLYTAITYALLQYAHKLLGNFVQGAAALVVLAIVGIGLLVLQPPGAHRQLEEDSVLTLTRRFVFLAGAQTAIYQVRELFLVSEISPTALRIEFVAVATMLLLLTHALTHSIEHSRVLDRTLTLLLYMYTDAVEVVLRAMASGPAAATVCVALYLLLRSAQTHLAALEGLSVLVRGVSMVCINVVLAWISDGSSDLPTKAGTLLLFLFMSDFGIGVVQSLEEVRGYLLWKTAQIVYLDFLAVVHDVRAGMALGLVLVACKALVPTAKWPDSLTTVLQLTTLVLVNMVLGPLTSILRTVVTIENVVIGFNVVIIVNLCVTHVQSRRRTEA